MPFSENILNGCVVDRKTYNPVLLDHIATVNNVRNCLVAVNPDIVFRRVVNPGGGGNIIDSLAFGSEILILDKTPFYKAGIRSTFYNWQDVVDYAKGLTYIHPEFFSFDSTYPAFHIAQQLRTIGVNIDSIKCEQSGNRYTLALNDSKTIIRVTYIEANINYGNDINEYAEEVFGRGNNFGLVSKAFMHGSEFIRDALLDPNNKRPDFFVADKLNPEIAYGYDIKFLANELSQWGYAIQGNAIYYGTKI